MTAMLNSGRLIMPDNMEVPTLTDIAIGLCRQIRFAGQTDHLYSVMCHTWTGYNFATPRARLHMLLHDSAEAVVTDIPRPWKTKEQEELELVVRDRIYESLAPGLSDIPEEIREEVNRIDNAIGTAEARVLGFKYDSGAPVDPLHVELTRMHVNEDNTMKWFVDPWLVVNQYVRAVEQYLNIWKEENQ